MLLVYHVRGKSQVLSRALGDDADNPGFSETLPRRGYRFTASVAPASSPATAVAAMSSSPTAFAPLYERRKESAVTDRRYNAGAGSARPREPSPRGQLPLL
jgi:hypothetical protein